MSNHPIITIEVYGYDTIPQWEHSGIKVLSIENGSLPFCDDEINLLCDSLDEIRALRNERWHRIKLERKHDRYSPYVKPDEVYYKKISIELVLHVCLSCGKQLSKDESDLIDVYGVEPYCSQWCAELGNGVPMPVSQGALTYDRIFNQPDKKPESYD